MFTELDKYLKSGSFIFRKGDNLKSVSKNVPNLPGVYYFVNVQGDKSEIVYIGKSGTMLQKGEFKNQLLNDRLNNKQDGVKRQVYLDLKFKDEEVDAINIFWFITFDEHNQDLPSYVEGILVQKYYDHYRNLPKWNKYF